MITVNDQALYSRIDGSGYRNIWVVGDLHGCYTLLMNELHRVDFDPAQDLLISVGDLIDRGTENVECLELLQMPWFRAVMGNHERLMIDALSPAGNVNNWLMNGGQWFFMLDSDKEVLARALDKQEQEMLARNCAARRPGRDPYEMAEYIALLIRQDDARVRGRIKSISRKRCGKCGERVPVNSCPCNGDSQCWVTKGWHETKLIV